MPPDYNYNPQYLGNEAALSNGISGSGQQIFGNGRMNPGAGDFNISSLIGVTDPNLQMLMNRFLMPILTKQMGPNAIAANYGQGNVYTEGLLKNAMGDRGRVMEFGKKQDAVPMQNAMSGIAKMMGVNMGDREKEAMASMMPMISEMMPGLESLIPGGLDSLYGARGSAYKMAEGMYAGGRYRTDPVTGDRKMSGQSILDVTKKVHENLYGDNADISEMNGLTAGQAGGLFDEMQKRGMTGGGSRSRGDSLQKVADEMGKTIGDISELPELDQKLREIDANGISQKLKSMSKAVSAMKEIFGEAGQPNAPMSQVMGAIESLTQTNMQSMKPAEVENLIRSTHNASKIAGITMPQAYAQMGNVAGMLDRAGGDRIFAADTYIKATHETAAGKRIFGESSAFGRLTPDKQLNLNEQVNVQATIDPITNEYAKIINAVEKFDAKLPEGSDIAAIYKALKDPNNNGEYTDASGKKKTISSIRNDPRGINGILKDAGVSNTSIGYLSDEALNKQTIYENKGLQPAGRAAMGEREESYLRLRFQGIGSDFSKDNSFKASDEIKKFMQDKEGMDGVAEKVARDLVNVDAKGQEDPQGVALNSIVSTIEKSQNRKLSEEEKKSLAPIAASMVTSATRHFVAKKFPSLAAAQEALSPRIQKEAAIIKEEADQTSKFQSALSSLGKSNVTQRISDFIQKGDEYTTVGEGLQALLGYVPGEAVSKLLQPEIEDIKSKYKEYDNFNATTAKSEYLTNAIAVNNSALAANPSDPALKKEKEELKKELEDNNLLGNKSAEDTYKDRVATSKDNSRYQLSNAQKSKLNVLEKNDSRSKEEEAQYQKLDKLKKVYNDAKSSPEEKAAASLANMESTYNITAKEFKGKTAQELSPNIKSKLLDEFIKSTGNIDTRLTSLQKLAGGFTERKDLSAIDANLSSIEKEKKSAGVIGLNKFIDSYSQDSKMLEVGGKEGKEIIDKIRDKVKKVKDIQEQFGITEQQALTGDFLEAKVVSKEKLDELKQESIKDPKNKNKEQEYKDAKENYDKFYTPNEEYKKVIDLKTIELERAQEYNAMDSTAKAKHKPIALKNIDASIAEIRSSNMPDSDKKMAIASVESQRDTYNSSDISQRTATLKQQHTALTKPEEILKQNILHNKKFEVAKDEERRELMSKLETATTPEAKTAIKDALQNNLAKKESVMANFKENETKEKRLGDLKERDKLTKEVAEYASSKQAMTPESRKELRDKQEAVKDYDLNEERKTKLKDTKTTQEDKDKLTKEVAEYEATKPIDKNKKLIIEKELKTKEEDIKTYDNNQAKIKKINDIHKDYKNEVIKVEGKKEEEIAAKLKGVTSLEKILPKDKEDILKLSGMTDAHIREGYAGTLNDKELKERKFQLIYEKQKAIEAGIKYGEAFVVDGKGVAKKATDAEVESGNFSYIDRTSGKVTQSSNKHIGEVTSEERTKYAARKNVEGIPEGQRLAKETADFQKLKEDSGMKDFSNTEDEKNKITKDIQIKRGLLSTANDPKGREALEKLIGEKQQEIKNIEDPEYMKKAKSKWTDVEDVKKQIESKEKDMSNLKKKAGISDKLDNSMLIEPSEPDKEEVRRLRGEAKPDATEINKIIKDSGADASKFLGLSAIDKETAQKILAKKELATDVERINLKLLEKKSGLEEGKFETTLKVLDKIPLYGNASHEEKEKISKEAKALKLLKDDKQGKIDEFEKLPSGVKSIASSGGNMRGFNLSMELTELTRGLNKTIATGGNTKLSGFDIANMQRHSTLLDAGKDLSAVNTFFDQIKAPRPMDTGRDGGRKEAAILSSAMSAAADIEIDKAKPDQKAAAEKRLGTSAEQMNTLRKLVRKSDAETTDKEKELIKKLGEVNINKRTFGDEEKVKDLERIASNKDATRDQKLEAENAREEYKKGEIGISGMRAISNAIPAGANRLSADAKPVAGATGPIEVKFPKSLNLEGSLVLKGKNAEITAYGVPSHIDNSTTV